jgi:hypothetical protein
MQVDKALTNWIFQDDILQDLPESYMKQFKNYVSMEPSWRRKESIYCDLYFQALFALNNED